MQQCVELGSGNVDVVALHDGCLDLYGHVSGQGVDGSHDALAKELGR